MENNESPLARRTLPAERQVRIVLLIGAAALAMVVLGWVVSRIGASVAAVQEGRPAAPNLLRLSAAQLATLQISVVAARAFHSEEITEGRIALNGDTATQVFSPYSGRVLRVLASPGEAVKQGAPLLRIEASEYVQGRTDLQNAAATLKLARANETRRHAAYEANGGSLQEWQQAQADLAAAQTAYAAARNRLHILGKSDADIEAIGKAVDADAVTYVVAPIGGIITDRQVGPGQYLQAGSSTPIFTIGDLSTVWLVADVRETDAPLIRPGQKVRVRVLALPGQLFEARVTAIGAQVDAVTHRLQVRATLANPGGKLKPQMFANFSILTSGDSEAPAVPGAALVREGDQVHVWVVQADDTLESRPIRIGRIAEGMVEVLEGLKVGERVVTRGALFLDHASQPG